MSSMREIGGYMDLERYGGDEYHQTLLRFNTVRSSIAFVMQEKKYRKLYIPRYLCSSVRIMLERLGYAFEYYSIDEALCPLFEKQLEEHEAILIVNYYGQYSQEYLRELSARYRNVIVDNTQAFFQRPWKNIDTVYTCRKYFGVPDGAYLSLNIQTRNYDSLPEDQSRERMNYILGRFEDSASEYYREFQRVDELFQVEQIKKMSQLTRNLLKSIDYDSVKEKRKQNAEYLHRYLRTKNRLKPDMDNCLYMYPFFIENGYMLKRRLIEKKIYVPTLWPNVLEECGKDSYEHYLADNLVLLPIDQRYQVEDMEYMLDQIKSSERGMSI